MNNLIPGTTLFWSAQKLTNESDPTTAIDVDLGLPGTRIIMNGTCLLLKKRISCQTPTAIIF